MKISPQTTWTLSSPAGESSVTTTVAFTVLEDNLSELNETFRLRAVPSGLANSDFATITIVDNDLAPTNVTLSITPAEADESAQTVSIEVAAELGGMTRLASDVEVEITTTGDTAVAGADFQTATTTLTIPAGERRATGVLIVTVLDDTFDEVDETLTLTGTIMGGRSLTVTPATFTIRDNDATPTRIGLSATGPAITEGGGPVDLKMRATLLGGGTRPEATTVTLEVVDLTATLTDDYSIGGALPEVAIPAGQFFGEADITITPVQDALYEGDEMMALRGTNLYPALPVNGVALTILDDDPSPTTVALSFSQNTVRESEKSVTQTITATLEGSSTLTEDLRVNITIQNQDGVVRRSARGNLLGGWLVIPAGESAVDTSVVLSDLDDSVDDDDEVLELRGSTTNPDITVTSDTLTITDDDTAELRIFPSGLIFGEGGSRFYEVRLGSQPSGNVTVTIDIPVNAKFTLSTHTLTFTPENWIKWQDVTVTSLVDPDRDTELRQIIAHTIDSSDTVYRSLSTVNFPVTVYDIVGASLEVNEPSLTVAEGGTGTYTVVLDMEPTGDVTVTITGAAGTDASLDDDTLTFTTGNWQTPQTVTVTAGLDSDITNDSVTLTHKATGGGYDDADTVDVAVTITDRGAGVTIPKTSLAIEEGESDTYTVVLDTQPEGDVTVTIEGNAGTDASLDKTTLTFTDLNWATPQTVTVTAERDRDTDDEDDVTLTHTVASAADANYDGVSADSVTVSITDDGATPGVTISKASLDIEEGESDTYTVVLNTVPAGDVTVTIEGNTGTDVSLDKTTLTFTDQDWSAAQTVTVTAELDVDDIDEDDVTLTHTVTSDDDSDYNGISVDSVTVSVTDPDEAGVSIFPTSITVLEGDSTKYAVVLDTLPTGEVTVTINDPTDNTEVTADPATLTFTTANWYTPQLVTVNAASDSDSDEDSATVTHSVSGYGTVTTADEVAVTVSEGERVDVEIKHETQRHSVREGRSKDIKVLLDMDPERTLVIALTGNPVRGASSDDYTIPAFVIFSPGETEQAYTFTAVDDTIDDDGVVHDHERVNVGFTDLPAGVSVVVPRRAFVDIVDNDRPETVYVSFADAAVNLSEGGSKTLGVRLNEPPERQVNDIPLVWEFLEGATNADTGPLISGVSFGPTSTSTGFPVRLNQDRIDERGEGLRLTFGELPEGVQLGTPSETIFTFVDDDDAGVTVNPTSLTVAEGGDEEYTVVLTSEPTADVTVTIAGHASTDVSLSETILTFTSSTWNTEQTVTVTAGQDSDALNDSVTLTHTVASSDTLYAGISADSVDVTVDDDETPVSVAVAFGSATYSVEESDDTSTGEKENEVEITVTLSADPERTVTIPITAAGQDGADGDDYSVASSVVFNAGETSQTITFVATADEEDDDGESVKLTFGSTMPTGVAEGTIKETVVSITDDDDPTVSVSFGSAAYSVDEGGTVAVAVSLSADPERGVTIPIVRTDQVGADGTHPDDSDYSGVPASVEFSAGETSKTITFAATADDVDDDGESVRLTFDTDNLPDGVAEGTIKETVVSINDDDDPSVSVSFGSAAYSVEETDDTTTDEKENEAEITVSLSADPERRVTVWFITTDQGDRTQPDGDDYSGVPASVVFEDGETEKTFIFAAKADDVDDDGESVKLEFATLPTRVAEGAIEETVISINDDDLPTDVRVEFEQGSYTVGEGSTVMVKVTLSEDPERAVAIPITAAGQDGADGDDYSVADSVTFNAGDTEKTITFTAAADADNDDGESVKLAFGTLPAGVAAGTIEETEVLITDDDVPSVSVAFGSATYSVEESDDTGTSETKENEVAITVALSADPERTVTIPVTAAGQDGADGDDYSVPASVVFNSGETSKTITFAATADEEDDDGESVKLTFGSTLPTGVAEGRIKETVVSINDDDVPSSVSVAFGSAAYSVDESDDASTTGEKENEVEITVTLSADPERTVTIPITKYGREEADADTEEAYTEDELAAFASSADYSVPASVVFNSGETSKTFIFSAKADDVDDDGESVRLTFGTRPTGVAEGTTKQTVVSINDDDVLSVSVSFGSATYSVEETDDPDTTEIKENEVEITVSLSADPERRVTIWFITTDQGDGTQPDGDDYSGVPASVVFEAGETEKTFIFVAKADDVDDDGESVKLEFATLPGDVEGGTIKQTVISINDDDLPTDVRVEFEQETYTVGEGSTVMVKVTLSEDPERAVAIPITAVGQDGADGDDYSVASSVTFNAGDTEKTITFTAAADADNDDGESVKLTFGTLPDGVSEGTTAETEVLITDDDVPSVSVAFGSATYSVEESDDTGTSETKENEVAITVALSADPERTVTIPVTAAGQDGADGDDYSVPASVVFNAGETSKTITFAATADDVDDDGESVKLTFGSTLPTGVDEGTIKETVVSIIDDDVPSSVTVNFGSGSYSVSEGGTTTVKITLSDDPEKQVTVPLTKTNQDGASDSDYSGIPDTVVFVAGDTEKTFTVSAASDRVSDAGEGVKLTFDTDNLPTGVAEGTVKESVVSILDVAFQGSTTVKFEAGAYGVGEGSSSTVKLIMSQAPGSDVVIPISQTEQGGASSSDYSGVPASVTFGSADTERSFTFSATADTVDDDGESVKLEFGTLPSGITSTSPSETTVSIIDDDDPADRLMSLVVSPKDIDGFDSEVTSYMVGVAASVAQATITATPYRSDDTITINGTDATNGEAYTVDLSVGLNTFEVVVRSVGSTDPATYKVYIGRGTADHGGWKAGDDLDTLRAAGNTSPLGIWSDGTTIWISDVSTATLYAYSQADGTRDDGKDIALGSAVMGPTGIWSDETTIWVISTVEETVFAYTLSSGARDSSSDISLGSDLMLPVDLWSDGVTMWIVDSSGTKLYAYTLSGGARDTSKDIDLDSENAAPGGVWSDGTTIWVTDSNDRKLYAYDLSGKRVAGHDIDLHSRNSDAFNLWGNTDTIWVANNINDVSSPFNRIFTYNNVPVTATFGSATYSVEESDDTSTTDMEENEIEITVTLNTDPQRQVVLPITATNQGGTNNNDYSGVPGTLTFESGDTEKTFSFTATEDTVEDGGESVKLTFGTLPLGVAGGTNTEAVVSIIDDDTGVSFERMAYEASEGDTVDIKLTLSSAITKEVTVPLDKTELGGVSNSDYSGIPETVKFESGETEKEISFTAVEDEIDDDGESVKLRFGSLPNGVVPGVNDETIVAINDNDDPADRLMSLVVSPKDIDGFDPEVTDYMVGVGASITQATITATPYRSNDTVTINGTEITNGTAHSVSLSAGLNTFAIVVNSSATADSTTYTVYIGRGTTDQGGWKAGDDLDTLRNAGNIAPAGIWSNGTTMWIADSVEAKLYAYTLADGSRDSGKDITLHSDNSGPAGIWSDETTIWVADQIHTTIFAYTLSDGSRDTSKEFTRSSGNTTAWGIWSDGTTMWVVDWNGDKLYAYTLADGSRDSDKDFNLASDNDNPRGLWSNGTTMWIVDADADADKLYAYDLSGTRIAGYDIDLHSSNSDVAGIWGDDDTAWVVNSATDDGSPFDRVYSYNNVPVTVSFGSATYSVEESDDTSTTGDKENEVVVTVTLSADPERTLTIPITKTDQGGASSADYSGVPANVVFNDGETSKTFTFVATADTVDDDGESVKLTFGTLPTGVTEGNTKQTVVSINDDDESNVIERQTNVSVSFKISAHSVPEGGTASIEITLSNDPEETVEIPVSATGGTGVTDSDYSGVPSTVTFNSGDTEKSFTFTAVQDQDDEDDETVTLTFGDLPDGVSEGSVTEATVCIRDSLRVSFDAAEYEAHEGGDDATVTVHLDGPASWEISIPLTATGMDGATSDDWTGVPDKLTFAVGDTSKEFTVVAFDDAVEDDDESVQLTFGDLPPGVVEGSPSTATVVLMNMELTKAHTECPEDSGARIILDSLGEITEAGESQYWRISLDPYRTYLIEVFGSDSESDVTGADLPSETLTLADPRVMGVHNHDKSMTITRDRIGDRLDLIRGSTASGWHHIEVGNKGKTGTYRIRVRVNNVCVMNNGLAVYPYFGGPDGYTLDIPADISSDTRRISTKEVGSESILGDNWNWYWESEPDVDWFQMPGLSEDVEYNIKTWAPDRFSTEDQATDLKIVGVYDSEGNLITGTASSSSGKRVNIRFQPDSDGMYFAAVSSGSSDRTGVYRIKIEAVEGSGNSTRDQDDSDQDGGSSEEGSGSKESKNDDGDTKSEDDREPGSNDGAAGSADGKEENSDEPEHTNTPATGQPAITGEARVGQTLNASTSGIQDEDGVEGASFTYQWRAGGADISGANSASYTLTTNELGETITVQVSFTDDEGSAETLVSGATAAVIPENPPPKPTNLQATKNDDGSITLTWSAPDDDTVTGYRILRRLPQVGEDTLSIYVRETGGTATTFTDTNTTPFVQHVYRVKAINPTGLSNGSNLVTVDP